MQVNLCSINKRDYFGMMKQIGFNYKKIQTLDPKQQQTVQTSKRSVLGVLGGSRTHILPPPLYIFNVKKIK